MNADQCILQACMMLEALELFDAENGYLQNKTFAKAASITDFCFTFFQYFGRRRDQL